MRIDPRLSEIDNCLYRLATRALIFHEGKVLLVREKDADWWSFPGGGVDWGENISQSFPRELAEELGVSEADFNTDYHIVHVTMGSVVLGLPRANLFYRVDIPFDKVRAGNDVHEVAWLELAELEDEILPRYVGSVEEAGKFMEILRVQAAK